MATLSVDFGGTAIKIGLRHGSAWVGRETIPVSGSDVDLRRVAETSLSLLKSSRVGTIEAVGIALPGVLDEDGRLLSATGKYAWAEDVRFTDWSRAAFGLNPVVENDARAALWGEAMAGCAVGASDVVILTFGTGIGTAALVDGHLVHGRTGHATILGGHLTVDLEGPDCPCGNVGCAEAVASTWALQRDALAPPLSDSPWWRSRVAEGPIGVKDLVDRDGADPASTQVLSRYIRAWGAAAVNMCHSFDPRVVVLTGAVMRSAGKLLPRIEAYVNQHLWVSAPRPAVVTPADPESSVLLGLALLAASERQSSIS